MGYTSYPLVITEYEVRTEYQYITHKVEMEFESKCKTIAVSYIITISHINNLRLSDASVLVKDEQGLFYTAYSSRDRVNILDKLTDIQHKILKKLPFSEPMITEEIKTKLVKRFKREYLSNIKLLTEY